jgi:putative Ca2+/H+ antiporter (TMEM165/GDT1 family)
MDFNLFGISFVTVFISELGDKSQLAAIALGGSTKSLRAVFLGTAAALLSASLLCVLLGDEVAQFLPIRWIKVVAAIGFAILGLRLLMTRAETESEQEQA